MSNSLIIGLLIVEKEDEVAAGTDTVEETEKEASNATDAAEEAINREIAGRDLTAALDLDLILHQEVHLTIEEEIREETENKREEVEVEAIVKMKSKEVLVTREVHLNQAREVILEVHQVPDRLPEVPEVDQNQKIEEVQ